MTEENGSTSLFEGSEIEDRSQFITDFDFKVLTDGTGDIYTSSTSNSSIEDSAADLILPSEA